MKLEVQCLDHAQSLAGPHSTVAPTELSESWNLADGEESECGPSASQVGPLATAIKDPPGLAGSKVSGHRSQVSASQARASADRGDAASSKGGAASKVEGARSQVEGARSQVAGASQVAAAPPMARAPAPGDSDNDDAASHITVSTAVTGVGYESVLKQQKLKGWGHDDPTVDMGPEQMKIWEVSRQMETLSGVRCGGALSTLFPFLIFAPLPSQ